MFCKQGMVNKIRPFFTETLEYLNKNAVICDPKFKEHVEDVSDYR